MFEKCAAHHTDSHIDGICWASLHLKIWNTFNDRFGGGVTSENTPPNLFSSQQEFGQKVRIRSTTGEIWIGINHKMFLLIQMMSLSSCILFLDFDMGS